MWQHVYQVELKGYSTKVRAFNQGEAVILAQAEAIKNGSLYQLVSIELVR